MLNDLLTIKGVGEKTKKSLEKLGVYNISDLFSFVPRDYDKYEEVLPISNVVLGKTVSIEGILVSKPSFFSYGRTKVVYCIVADGSGKIRITWFNSPFIFKKLIYGRKYVFRGRAYERGKQIIFNQPRIYSIEEYKQLLNTMVPIYHTTKGIKNFTIQKTINNAFEKIKEEYKKNKKELSATVGLDEIINDYLPDEILDKRELYKLSKAYYHMHFPIDKDDLLKARKRLVYDEFLLYELGLLCFLKEKRKEGFFDLSNAKIGLVNKVIDNLPYKLTISQEKVMKEIFDDFNNKKVLNKLIQGDVGSGKTIVAFLIMIYLYENGYQSTLIAPTEVLANQHYNNFLKIIKDNKLDIKVAFLSGSTSLKEKKDIKQKLKDKKIDMIIGTHAILTDDVLFNKLGLAVIDEQQRFGVNQRKKIEEKGDSINIIHLSATPIPRTLSLLLFKGLDISTIEEKPQNRASIKTAIISTNDREKAYKLMLSEVKKNNRCYIICPMIDEEKDDDVDMTDLENVKDYKKKIEKYINANSDNLDRKINVEVLHGKMKEKEKDKIMQDFYNGNIDILISTTVIEVGIDCKDATFMMVENAECFGLATLHQLRGRVGRSDKKSYCIFVDSIQNEKSKERLKVLYDSDDGFYIANQDLKLRGAGDVFGIRQSGDVGFKIGDIYNDNKILKDALDDASMIMKDKKVLESKEYLRLKRKLDDYVKNGYTI